MAIGRRSRTLPPSYYNSSARSLSQRSFGMPSRNPLSFGGRSGRASSMYDTRGDDYALFDRVSDVSYLSNAALDESDDTVRRSRGRDAMLLRNANNAIPRGSARETTSLTSSAAPFGPRRFPRRFGKASNRKTAATSHYGGGKTSLATSDLVAGPGPAPSGSWRRYGSVPPRGAAPRSAFADEEVESGLSSSPSYRSRAQSVDPISSRSLTASSPSSLLRNSRSSFARRSLPPVAGTVRPSKVLNVSSSLRGSSLSPIRAVSVPFQSSYDPLYVEYEPDNKPAGASYRRRPKIVATSRRPAGNYYERLLRKRGKQSGRFGPYYDLESLEGSDLSVLSDDGGTYDAGDYDYNYDVGVRNPPSSSDSSSPFTLRHYGDPSSSSYSVSSSSPYFVDQDTEFVPFKPRPLQTKGLLELSPYNDYNNNNNDDDNDNDDNNVVACSRPFLRRSLRPSPTTDLSLSTYLPAHLTPTPSSTFSLSSSLPPLPYRSVLPYTSAVSADALALTTPSSTSSSSSSLTPSSASATPSQAMLESLVASSIARAKSALNSMAIPAYQGASLLLSVEGAGVTPEGKRVDFTYTPPPISLYGRGPTLDDKLLGLRPSSTLKPVDSFLAGYVERMNALKQALNDGLDRDRSRRLQYGLTPLETGPRASITAPHSRSSAYVPYSQSHEYVPVRHLASKETERVPVTSYRRRYDDGRTHRMDVISLGEMSPRLGSGSGSRAINIPLPASATGGQQLSVLEKINIKVSSESYATPQASVAARRVARGRSLAPRAASVPPRPYVYPSEVESAHYGGESTTTSVLPPARYVRPLYAPQPQRRLQESDFYGDGYGGGYGYYGGGGGRAMSVPPQALGFREPRARRLFAPPPQVPLDGWRDRVRAQSVAPVMMMQQQQQQQQQQQFARLAPYYWDGGVAREQLQQRRHLPYYQPAAYSGYIRRANKPFRPMLAPQVAAIPTAGMTAHKVPRGRYGAATAAGSTRPCWGYMGVPIGLYSRRAAVSEQDQERGVGRVRVLGSTLARATLASGRGRYPLPYYPPQAPAPKARPIQESLSGFPLCYVPRKGKGPSNRSKAAIIASKMEPDPMKRRRPRSEYAAQKYREYRKDGQEGIYTRGTSGGLLHSRPPLQKLTSRKAIRTDDGYSKPKNLLSWQYRLDSLVNPTDVIYQPSSYIRIKEQIRNAQERMDKHRQMIDRYLPEEGEDTGDVASKIRRKMAEMEKRDALSGGGDSSRRSTVTIPDYYACGVDPANPPVSDLRRRIRKTLSKSRKSADY